MNRPPTFVMARDAVILETDWFNFDAFDLVLIQASWGNDEIVVDSLVSIGGTVDGSAGTDTCTAPALWNKQSCEG